jgi:hypothetical protein
MLMDYRWANKLPLNETVVPFFFFFSFLLMKCLLRPLEEASVIKAQLARAPEIKPIVRYLKVQPA